MPNLTQTQLSKVAGISQARISIIAARGDLDEAKVMIRDLKTPLYDQEKAIECIAKNRDPQHDPFRQTQTKQEPKKEKVVKNLEKKQQIIGKAGMSTMSFVDAKTLIAQFQAALLKLKYDEESGKTMSTELVGRSAFESHRLIKEQLQAIPDRCSPLVAAESSQFECKQILQTEIDYILNHLSETLKVASA